MTYEKTFDPPPISVLPRQPGTTERADLRDGSVYVYTDQIVLAVNVALATGRPLLLRGGSGSGKSSLAHNVARHLRWRYYEEVVTSRTQARDLLWTFDALRRLRDAQAGRKHLPNADYVEPGVLWWAFDPLGARRRGAGDDARISDALQPGRGGRARHAVVLLDEIDKADPDTPNNLLVPLGSLEFDVTDTGTRVTAKAPPLVFITTNGERELPPAFMRRCLVVVLEDPKRDRLIEIAKAHYGEKGAALYTAIADLAFSGGGEAPSAAEYLDAVRAARELKVQPTEEDPVWKDIASLTLFKPTS